MEPALRTHLKESLNFEAGQGALMLVAAGGEILSQGWVEGQGGTILQQHAAKVLPALWATISAHGATQQAGQQQFEKFHQAPATTPVESLFREQSRLQGAQVGRPVLEGVVRLAQTQEEGLEEVLAKDCRGKQERCCSIIYSINTIYHFASFFSSSGLTNR